MDEQKAGGERKPTGDVGVALVLPREDDMPSTELASSAPTPSPVVEVALPPGLSPGSTQERILIVIPCLNEAAFIGSVIADLLRDAAAQDGLIVVADGGSTDGTRDIVAKIAAADPRVKLLPNPQKFQAPGVNHAVRAFADGFTWLARIDAHAHYPPNYVADLVAEARKTGATSVVVSLDAHGDNPFQRATAAAQNSRLGAGGSPHRRKDAHGWVDHGHHALFRTDAFRAIGGYDEGFTHNEDAEFDRRLTDYGGRIWLTDQVSVVYHPRSEPGALWRQYVNYGSGRARTILKHRMSLKIRQMLPAAVAPAVLAAPFSVLFWSAGLPALLWAAASMAYGAILGLKARDPAVLLCGAVAMEMHLAWSIGFWREVLFGRRRGAAPTPHGTTPVRPAE